MKVGAYISAIIIITSFGCGVLSAQKLSYDLYLFGDKIGSTIIEKKDSMGMTIYRLVSHSRARVLFSEHKSDLIMQVLMGTDGRLLSSYFHNDKSDEQLETIAQRGANNLIVDKQGERTTISKDVYFTSLMLYFQEPKSLVSFFSERLGVFLDLIKKSEGVYKASIDNTNSTYRYQNGKLVELEMNKNMLGTVYMRLVQ